MIWSEDMFLTIGEKIKAARKKYNLKQVVFEPYGFSRNYISMIETNKRVLNDEASQLIYQALCELTDAEFEKEYSYKTFCEDPQTQAYNWLTENIDIKTIKARYGELIHIAKKYELSKCLINIESTLGEYYKIQRDYFKSNDHFLKAIAYCIHFNENNAALYEKAGVNLFNIGKYKESLSYFELALQCLDDSTPLLHKVNYDIAISYLYDDEYDKSLPWIDKVMKQDENLAIKASAYLLKETALKKLGDAEGGRKVLLEYIEKDFHRPYIGIAYHNLAVNYDDCKLYDEALESIKLSLEYPVDDFGRALRQGLMGTIYFKLGKFEDSLELFKKTKDDALRLCNASQCLMIFEWGLDLYWHFQEYNDIMSLLTEANELVLQQKISKSSYYSLQNKIYKKIINHLEPNQEKNVKLYELLQKIT